MNLNLPGKKGAKMLSPMHANRTRTNLNFPPPLHFGSTDSLKCCCALSAFSIRTLMSPKITKLRSKTRKHQPCVIFPRQTASPCVVAKVLGPYTPSSNPLSSQKKYSSPFVYLGTLHFYEPSALWEGVGCDEDHSIQFIFAHAKKNTQTGKCVGPTYLPTYINVNQFRTRTTMTVSRWPWVAFTNAHTLAEKRSFLSAVLGYYFLPWLFERGKRRISPPVFCWLSLAHRTITRSIQL